MDDDLEKTKHSVQSRVFELIETGSELAGSAAGAALGFLGGGPVGAAAGAAGGALMADVLRRVGSDVAARFIAPRQRVRIGAALSIAADEITKRLERGDVPRSDSFFQSSSGRSDADEILEGVLLHAANEYEEKKVSFIANLFVTIAFDDSVSPGRANYLLQLADRVTYRQLTLLALFASKRFQAELELLDAGRSGGVVNRDGDAVADADALGHAGLLGVLQDGGRSANMASVLNGGSFSSISLAKAHPTSMGFSLYRLMGLERLAEQELREALDDLQ